MVHFESGSIGAVAGGMTAITVLVVEREVNSGLDYPLQSLKSNVTMRINV